MAQEEIQQYNKMCAEFLGWELFKAKSASHWEDGIFKEYDEPGDVYIENPTEEFKEHLILSNPEQVGLKYDFKLFEDYHFKSTLKFHSDWNWIMKVVDKIELLYEPFNFEISSGHIIIKTPGYCTNTFEGETKKEAVVQAINQFLIFYNKN